jgi:hypothetical protein
MTTILCSLRRTLRRHRRSVVKGGGGLLLAVLLLLACRAVYLRHHPEPGITPDTEAVFTSTRCVMDIAVAPDGSVWAATRGGVLWRKSDGSWRKFTRRDGLPSHEALHVDAENGTENGTVLVTFPTGTARWNGTGWETLPASRPALTADALPDQVCAAVWQGVRYASAPDGLFAWRGGRWQNIPLPASGGTHVSALLPHGETLWAALFGDNLWAFDGKKWQPLNFALPVEAREITAMAANGNTLWIGTRRAGLWEYRSGTWTPHLQKDEPVDHNCQALALYHGSLFVSTLEDGLAIRTPTGWGHGRDALLSSNAPRQMVVFKDRLYLRHGSGRVDRFDGAHWERNICGGLPRKQVSALAADKNRLYAAQWGGWSDYDGTSWTHHLDLPALQGLPITALCPQGDALWIGTQGRGLAQWNRNKNEEGLKWHDERGGLPDDWITALACVDGTVYAGTFVGGLAAWDGANWKTALALKGENVTALEPDGTGGVFVATRTGLWHRDNNGSLAPVRPASRFLASETQALCRDDTGLWIGTRTGLFFCPFPI